MDIEWKEGAVCYAGEYQRAFIDGAWWRFMVGRWVPFSDGCALKDPMDFKDFQLNTIKQGDFIKVSELDTKQKYDDAVEVFGLFGFERGRDYENTFKLVFIKHLKALNSKLIATDCTGKRKLTYPQLMAIGELKRLEIERDKSAPKIAPDLTPDVKGDEWTDEHYNSFYQLTKDDIKEGQIKIDAYFVNRMWKINQWDDTGAAFHVLKTLPRIANNKNPLKRELMALKKQVDLLCKMHGTDDANTN